MGSRGCDLRGASLAWASDSISHGQTGISLITQTMNRRFRSQMSSPLSLFNELTTPSLSSPGGVSSTSFRHESILEIMYLSEKLQLQISCIHTLGGGNDIV